MNWKYLITILMILVLRALDLYLTWLYTPDLSSEYNPIVSILGGSWHGLIATQLLFLCVIFIFGWIYFSKSPREVSIKELTFPDFIYCYFFSTLKPWPQRFFSGMANPEAHLIFNGFMFLAVSIMISLFAIVNNALLLTNVAWYYTFLSKTYIYFFPLIFFTIAITSALTFFAIEFHRYRRAVT